MNEFLRTYAYQWKEISKQPTLPPEIMLHYAHRLEWESVCEYRLLSVLEIIEFERYVDWKSLCRYQPLEEAIIERYVEVLPWSIVVMRQNLTMSIIHNYWSFLKPYSSLLVRYQMLDTDWMKEMGLIYPDTRMDVWAEELKWERCEQFGFEGNRESQVVYAYKSTQKDGYSILNRKIRYELGKWSCDWHCDGNLNHPNSFGLSAGHKNTALNFYPRGSLFKVAIPIQQLYCVTEEGVIRSMSMLPIMHIK